MRLSDCFEQKKDLENALAYAEQAISIDKNCLPAHAKKGDLLIGAKKYSEAKQAFQEMLTLAEKSKLIQNQAEAEYKLAVIALSEKDNPTAKKYLAQAISHAPKDTKFAESMAAIEFNEGNATKAEELLKALDNKSGNACLLLSRCLLQAGKNQEAVTELENCIKQDSQNVEARLLLSEIKWKEKDYRTSYSVLEGFDDTKLSKEMQSELSIRRGSILLALNKGEEGEKELSKALNLGNDKATQINKVARIYANFETYREKALKMVSDAVQNNPTRPDLKYTLSLIKFRSADYKGAIADLESQKNNLPEDGVYLLGMSYFLSGNVAQAQKVLEPLKNKDKFKSDPDFTKVFKN